MIKSYMFTHFHLLHHNPLNLFVHHHLPKSEQGLIKESQCESGAGAHSVFFSKRFVSFDFTIRNFVQKTKIVFVFTYYILF